MDFETKEKLFLTLEELYENINTHSSLPFPIVSKEWGDIEIKSYIVGIVNSIEILEKYFQNDIWKEENELEFQKEVEIIKRTKIIIERLKQQCN